MCVTRLDRHGLPQQESLLRVVTLLPRQATQRRAEHAAAHLLWELLGREGPYRRRWVTLARDEGLDVVDGEVSEEAVRRVVTDRWYEAGQLDVDPRATTSGGKLRSRVWKDRVNDVARGLRLSSGTLLAFIEAFAMSEADQEAVRRLHEDREAVGNPVPRPARIPSTLGVALAEHRTLVLRESHHVGANGLPTHHETIQTIQSIAESMTSYPYRFDTNEVLGVRVLRGGTAGEVYHVEGDMYAVDITLDRPLLRGEISSLRYVTRFRYAEQPRPMFVRSVPKTADLIEMEVLFHRHRLPRRSWFTVWEDWSEGSRVLYEVEVPPDALYRMLRDAGGTVVGFRWEW
jgi:hypothetical protein